MGNYFLDTYFATNENVKQQTNKTQLTIYIDIDIDIENYGKILHSGSSNANPRNSLTDIKVYVCGIFMTKMILVVTLLHCNNKFLHGAVVTTHLDSSIHLRRLDYGG